MKHVFGVSSHLAFYIYHRLVELDGLNKNDCIFFTTRNYMIPVEYQSTYTHVIRTSYNVSSRDGRVFAGYNMVQTRRNIQAFDRLVDAELQGEKFLWYTQICYNDICSLMVTKSNCVGYYIIEDGSGSYKTTNEATFQGVKAWLYRLILKPLMPRLFVLKNKMIETDHPKFKSCIATNDRCFPLHQQCTRVIGLPFQPVPLSPVPDVILSIDPMFLWISEDEARSVLYNLAQHMNPLYKRVAYKHHPYTLSNEYSEIYQKYNQWIHEYFAIELEELDSKVSLESALMAHRCDFYTATSSVAIYAHAMNCRCVSYMPLLRPYTSLTVPIIEELSHPIE